MKIWKVMIAFAWITMTSQVSLADEMLALKVGLYSLTPTGALSIDSSGNSGDLLNLENDLNMERSENLNISAALQLGDSRLVASYLPLTFNGNNALAQSVSVGHITIPFSVPMTTSLKADMYGLSYTYFLLNMDDLPTRLQLGVKAAANLVQGTVEIDALGLNIESTSATIIIPTVGLYGRVALSDFIGVVANASYMAYTDNQFLDIDVQVEFSPLPLAGIYVGYRHMDVKFYSNNLFVDTTLSGFYAGALIRF
ncbi:MAG: hypothetical protein R8M38_00495 [Mariprofundaceae bacterium]